MRRAAHDGAFIYTAADETDDDGTSRGARPDAREDD
jgi:hypothetical protein